MVKMVVRRCYGPKRQQHGVRQPVRTNMNNHTNNGKLMTEVLGLKAVDLIIHVACFTGEPSAAVFRADVFHGFTMVASKNAAKQLVASLLGRASSNISSVTGATDPHCRH